MISDWSHIRSHMNIGTNIEAERTRLKVSFNDACNVILRNGVTKNLLCLAIRSFATLRMTRAEVDWIILELMFRAFSNAM